jgi:dihydrolipoamide dehydrogenase
LADSSNKGRVVVLGAGPGGYPAAFLAAHHGFDVTLIDERSRPGGVCLNVGCIPSKALLHVAKLINESHESSAWGVSFAKPQIDIDKVRAWKDKVVAQLTGGLGALSKAYKVNFVQGRGKFDSNKQITVKKSDGSTEAIAFDFAIIATGSRPAMPKLFQIGDPRVMDSTAALELKDIPGKLLVVGGGYIGLEMATAYAALGSKVTVVEMQSGLLPGADRDVAEIMTRELTPRVEQILLDTRVTEVKADKAGIKVKLLGVDLNEERTYDRILISVGRVPNSQDLGLENLKVKVTERGFIASDHQRRTDEPNVFVIGDVAGEPQLAHKATHEGRVAVEAMAGIPASFQPAAIPAVVFTDPEVAWAGVTEVEAVNRGLSHRVVKFPWQASGRALTLGRNSGLTKLIVDPKSNRVLGVGIVGYGAGDLISEAVLAIEMGATAQDLALTIHPHPTTSETLMEAADLFFGHSAHVAPKR